MVDTCELAATGTNTISMGVLAILAIATALIVLLCKKGNLRHIGLTVVALAIVFSMFAPLTPLAFASVAPDDYVPGKGTTSPTDPGTPDSPRRPDGGGIEPCLIPGIETVKLADKVLGQGVTLPIGETTLTTKLVEGGTRYNWKYVASSADGMKLVALTEDPTTRLRTIYTSTDGGTNWTEQKSAGQKAWGLVASSADGLRLVATVVDSTSRLGSIYTSTDGGLTWTEQATTGQSNWQFVASSADGMRLVATAGDGFVYTSTDGGVPGRSKQMLDEGHVAKSPRVPMG